ncbi:pilin [Spartinivicinus poritis]|uniref:Pilin n=1 Tax=Spartinivicinus poritis TaxID=2994640 RepID=A0ABT5UEZ5_9GAMM|nr:pilin [Spartinivicinus sp. A2-2]MDE1464944.1 pilin [Spartinivicinus sp. A2-2]
MKVNNMRQYLTILLLFVGILTGCSESDKQTADKPKAAPEKVQLKMASFTEKSWLRTQLPADALAYLRVPNVWFLFADVESGFKYAQGNEQHVAQLKAIQQGLYQNLLIKMEDAIKPIASLLIKHINGPFEAAVLNNPDNPMMPYVVVATKLDFKQVSEFEASFTQLLQQQPMLQIIDKIDAQGNGSIQFAPMGVNGQFQFNAQTGHFQLVAAMGAQPDKLKSTLNSLAPVKDHPMYSVEAKTDASGKGLFGYINAKLILPIAQKTMKPEQLAGLKMSGFDKVSALAFGYGTSADKTRLKVIAEMPVAGFRAYLPSVKNHFDLSARGEIDSVGILSLPTEAQYRQIEATTVMVKGSSPEYFKAKEEFKKQTGFSIEQLLSILGPEVIYFSDSISDFIAVRLSKPEQLKQLINNAQQKKWIDYQEHKKNGVTIKHITTPFMNLDKWSNTISQESPVVGEIAAQLKTHYYWIEESGYMILSAVPQPLIERASRKDTHNIGEWLTQSQKQDLSSAFLGYSTSKVKLSRTSYHVYLQLLNALSDISGAQVDIFSLPHAGQLSFADKGSLGVNLDFNENYLALEFSFEQSILDLLYVGDYKVVAMIGILAAVAIPAYQDYTLRSQVSGAYYSAQPIQQEIRRLITEGTPLIEVTNGIGQILPATDYQSDYITSIEVNQGNIFINLGGEKMDENLNGLVLQLIVQQDESTGELYWQCSSDEIKNAYLPIACR